MIILNVESTEEGRRFVGALSPLGERVGSVSMGSGVPTNILVTALDEIDGIAEGDDDETG